MAVEYKRMQQRVGTYAQYEQYKDSILPNEFVAVTSGSPDTDDGSAIYFKNGTKEPKLIVDESKQKLELKKLKDELNVDGLDSRVTALENDSTDVEEYIDTAKSAIIDKIDNAKSNINDNIDTVKNSLSSQMSGSLGSVDIWLTNAKTEILDKLSEIKEEYDEKYDYLYDEMKHAEKNILRAFTNLADELSVGSGTVAGNAIDVMQGFASKSVAGRNVKEEN